MRGYRTALPVAYSARALDDRYANSSGIYVVGQVTITYFLLSIGVDGG